MRVRVFDGKFIKMNRLDSTKRGDGHAVLQIVHQDELVHDRVGSGGRKYEGLLVRCQLYPEWRDGDLYLRGIDTGLDDSAFAVPANKLEQVLRALAALERDLASKDGEIVEIDGRKYKLSLVKED